MARAAALLILIVLAGCDDSGPRNDVALTVANDGFQTVFVQVRAEGGGDFDDILLEYHLSPSESTFETFCDVVRLKVRVTRVSDGLILFDDFWDPEDLRRLHDNVVVSVAP